MRISEVNVLLETCLFLPQPKTCGCPKVLASITVFKKYGVKIGLQGQECCILKVHLELICLFAAQVYQTYAVLKIHYVLKDIKRFK